MLVAERLNGYDVRKCAEATAGIFDMLSMNDARRRTEIVMLVKDEAELRQQLAQLTEHLEQERHAVGRLTQELDRREFRIVRLRTAFRRAAVLLAVAVLGLLASLVVIIV